MPKDKVNKMWEQWVQSVSKKPLGRGLAQGAADAATKRNEMTHSAAAEMGYKKPKKH